MKLRKTIYIPIAGILVLGIWTSNKIGFRGFWPKPTPPPPVVYELEEAPPIQAEASTATGTAALAWKKRIDLPQPTNGLLFYCIDCQAEDGCPSGGTGAVAVAINLEWRCAGFRQDSAGKAEYVPSGTLIIGSDSEARFFPGQSVRVGVSSIVTTTTDGVVGKPYLLLPGQAVHTIIGTAVSGLAR